MAGRKRLTQMLTAWGDTRSPGLHLRRWHVVVGLLVLWGLTSSCRLDSARFTPPSGTTPPSVAPGQRMAEGVHAYQHGAIPHAVRTWLQAATHYAEMGQRREQSMALTQVAHASLALGVTDNVVQQLHTALALAEQAGDRAQMAAVFGRLGDAYLIIGPMEQAVQYVTMGLQLAQELGQPDLAAMLWHGQGNVYAAQQRFADALDAYKESARLAEQAEDHGLAARAVTHAAMVAVQQQRYGQAKILLDEAWEPLARAVPSRDTAYDLINMGLTYNELRVHRAQEHDTLLLQASQAFQQARAVAQAIADPLALSYAVGHLGALYEAERRHAEALTLTRQAVFAAQQANAPEALSLWQWQTGRLLSALGHLEDAIAAYRRAVATLQSLRHEMGRGYGPVPSFRNTVGPVYFELVDLLLQHAATLQERTQYQPYLAEARATVELFKAVELQDYFQDDCVEAARARVTPLDMVSQTAVIIYPILLPARLELLLSLSTGLERVTVRVSAETVTREVRALRRALEKRTTYEFVPHAQQLYDWLVRPLEPVLASVSLNTLVFVPDGALRTIPMAALHDGEQFLIRKYAVAVTPGLDVTDPRPLRREQLRLLAVGITEAIQDFPPLPYVAAELQMIRALYGGNTLLNEAFLVPRMENELRTEPYTMVHIATHGRFGGDVAQTFLLAFDDKLTIDQLDQMVGLLQFRDDPLELLTLSACQTATGDDRAALGLAGIAIKAGARSALATLWFINDQASSELVAEFYRQLQDPAVSRAVALQRAQLKLLRDWRYRHPSYWAPFLLINNWL